MLEYIEKNETVISPLELIANFVPSMYELNLVYNKTYKGMYHNIRVSLNDTQLKGAIRKAYELREDEYDSDMILRYLRSK